MRFTSISPAFLWRVAPLPTRKVRTLTASARSTAGAEHALGRSVGALAWLGVALALAAIVIEPPVATTFGWSWLIIAVIFFGFKAVVLTSFDSEQLRRVSVLRLIGFVLLWPGMDLKPFAVAARTGGRSASGSPARQPTDTVRGLLVGGLVNVVTGLAVLWIAQWDVVRAEPYLRAALGLLGGALVLLYGVFDFLAAMWEWLGVPVEKQWRNVLTSSSLADYWSVRWNRAFHDFVHQHVFLPLKRRYSASVALVGSFLFSGVLHDMLISVPARGGYGLPTLYFLLQALGIWCDRRWLSGTRWRRPWGALVLLAPVGLLFHPPFIHSVIIPQLEYLRAAY